MASKRRAMSGVARAFPLFRLFPFATLLACTTASQSSVLPDAGGADTSVPGSDTGAPSAESGPAPADASSKCTPANVQGYVPRWTPPKAPQSACTQAELASYAACLDSNDPKSTACQGWSGADASTSSACKSCVADSKATDPAWGPIVDVGTNGSERQLNVSGCLAIVLHDTGSGCAGSFQALQECESAACADNCQGASSTDLGICEHEADGAGCSNYLGPVACVYDAGATAQACLGTGQSTFAQKFATLAAVFCLRTDGGP